MMVFGLFSRKSQSAPVNPAQSTQSESSGTSPFPAQSQLRTPSPSIGSASIDKPTSPSSPPPPPSPSPPPELPVDSFELHALVQSVPPKTLHSYTLAHLTPTAKSATLAHLAAFFAALAPPPRLHCLRCHQGFFDVENTDRSCLVPHDDDSAEVERVGISRGGAAEYETLWACCGRTVEGDGDMGPPDGWCYEGKHTTDPKRARFRADSTLYDDKLTSCSQLGCHNPLSTSSRSTRKRTRPVEDDDDNTNDTASSASTPHSHSSEPSDSKRPTKRARTGTKGRTTQTVRQEDSQKGAAQAGWNMDVDRSPAHSLPPTTAPSPASKAKSKPKLRSKPSSQEAPKSSTRSPSTLLAPGTPCAHTRKVVVEIKSKSAPGSPTLKPKSSAASFKPKSCLKPAPLVPRVADTSTSAAKPKSGARVRLDADVRSLSLGKGRGRGKAKSLVEVVDTSVDGERE